MKLSQIPFKTSKTVNSELLSINARLLTQAAFIHQELAGVYTMLPLGLRVLNKIEAIIRKEMDKVGVEINMTALAPIEKWQQSKRFDTVDVLMKTTPANTASAAKNDSEYVLSPTHEDMVTPLIAGWNRSYKDLPVSVYQIQTKFRNEPRAKSGLLRGREFRMKDLYSFHASQEDLMAFYEAMKPRYEAIFEALGIGSDTYPTYASGGDFTKEYSHEYQTLLPNGEDTIYLDRENRIAYNKEVTSPEDAKKLGVDFEKLEVIKASEVGNIFPLITKFSDAFGYTYTDENGQQKPVFMGCYGIGSTRAMGVIVEKFADSAGMVWPKSVAPYAVHLIDINDHDRAEQIYTKLSEKGVEVLWDDRDMRPGEKFFDADLIGIPVRLVISQKNGDQIEWKLRTKDQAELISTDEMMERLTKKN
jgi:prolyl-tRNA synthetase